MTTTESSATNKSDDVTEAPIPRERINVHTVQNTFLIWLDNNIDATNADCHDAIAQLQSVVNSINTFTDTDQCVDFVTDIRGENVCLVISGAICQNVVPLIHDVPQLHTVLIFRGQKTGHE